MRTNIPVGIEVGEYVEPGYKPVIRSAGDWMAALMNGFNGSGEDPVKLEMHPETDELFVLIKGEARLVSGGRGEKPGEMHVLRMEQGVLYNVKAGVWHWTPMSEDAQFVVVEKTDTHVDGTTRYEDLSPEQRGAIKR